MAVQSQAGRLAMPQTDFNFEGIPNLFGGWPPDTQGDIGSNHYIQWINLQFAVWSINRTTYTQTLVYGPAPGNVLWQGFGGACETTNNGDPITLYDTQARRWFMSQFALPNFPNGPFYVCIAVSTTDDPTGTWRRYAYEWTNGVGQPVMNDYPKFGVWPDGYYMTVNQFSSGSLSWAGAGVAVFERDRMLLGLPAQMVKFDLFSVNSAFGGMLPSDLDGPNSPPPGAPNVFAEVDDGASLPPNDAMRLWQFHVDWTNPLSSTFGINGQPNVTLTVAAFNPLTARIPQPGTPQTLDTLADRLMYRLAYRNFGDHAALVVNHTVDAGAARAGVRWYEVRDPHGSPAIFQQGTYAPADGLHRWMGSIALDRNGNAALGYSVSSNSVYPSVRYAGRLAGDPPGEMSQGEAEIIAGSGAQTGHYRWGDYSMMGIDPLDDCTFWYTQEYIQTTGSNTWQTRVGAFKFPSCSMGPQGVLAGVVSDAAATNPIVGAQVRATASPTQTANATSGVGGAYSTVALVGTYTVTASAYAYLPSQITGVSIISGTTTTLNIALTPAATYVVSGTIRDSRTGWPLYAKLDITGYPGGSSWNDPATGYYSITLAEGITYTFGVNAEIPGYLPASRSIGPLTANRIENFALSVNPITCNAPGYITATIGIYSQTFEANNGGYTTAGITSWAWGMPSSGPGSAHSGLNVWATNLSGNYYDYEDGYITSPSIDLSAYSGRSFSLAWWQWLVTESGGDYASLEVSNDGGLTWTRVYGEVSGNVDLVWVRHALTLDPTYSVSNFRVRFRLRSNYYLTYPGWYMDDVSIGALACNPQSGGLIVGNVSDGNTGSALNGATVTNELGQTVTAFATPFDPGNNDAFYAIFSPAGAHPVTATMTGGYGADVHTPTVILSNTIRQDFNVPAGRLAYAPPAISVTLDMGTSMTRSFTLTNSGGRAATFELLELDKGATPFGPIEKPAFVVKPFRQQFATAAGLGLPPLPSAPPYAAGDVIQSWLPAGLGDAPWGIAFDSDDDTVWISDGWGSIDAVREYTPNGTPTGRLWTHTLDPNGPADMAYNFNTRTAWIMNVASPDNCIYEMDPDTGFTGAKICPGFWVSQRGLAYDPSTDTYFAGSWNDMMIYHFNSTGTMLDAVSVGLPIAGLAYNPDTLHLFVMVNNSPNPVYVLDAANNYALLGQFNISQGFGAYSGAGLEIDCDGNLWAVDQNTNTVYQFQSGETTSVCTRDVAWLSESPISGTIATLTTQSVVVSFDAGVPQITQPGQYYAQLKVKEDTPYALVNVPITMTAVAPATWGKLDGTVTGLGYCDATPGAPLSNATVFVQSDDGLTWTLTTGISGTYQVWLDQAHSPLTVTVSHAGYVMQTATGITVTQQQTTTQNFALRLDVPCVNADPTHLSITLNMGQRATLPLTLTNLGAGATTFNISEQPRGSLPAAAVLAGTPVNNSGETVTSRVSGVYPLAPGDFTSRASSPVPLTSLTVEPGTGYIYGQQNGGYGFYRYDPGSNSWSTLSSSPLYSENNGGAAYLDGKIYTVYTQNSYQMGVYDIASNTWSTITSTLGQGTGNITSDGEYLYLAVHSSFARYNPGNGMWSSLATPSIGFEPWGGLSYLNGTIYGHQGNSYNGFAKYDIASNVWTTLSPVPGGAVLGSAIDPAAEVYYAYGSYGGQNWYAFDLVSQMWSVSPLPLFSVNDGGLAFVGQAGVSGIYFVQGESGTGFGRFETAPYSEAVPWLSETPISGTVSAGGHQVISVTFDAGVPEVTQPGNYFATLNVSSHDPVHPVYALPITMTAVAPATWGKLAGTVTGLGYCDATPGAPLSNATVFVQSGDGLTWTLTTSISGTYQVWLDQAHSPLTVTVTAADHQTQQVSGVMVTGQFTTTTNFDLRWLRPCLSVNPNRMSVIIGLGMSTTLPLTLTNIGAAGTTFELMERSVSLPSLRTTKQPVAPKSLNTFMVDGGASDKPAPQTTRLAASLIQKKSSQLQAGTTVINFDDLSQPCSFNSTIALRDEYQSRGILFNGPGGNDGGAILDQCGSFGVSGYSSPNFLAFNTGLTLSNGGIPRSPEEITLLGTTSFIQVNAGSSSSSGLPITLEAFNFEGSSLGSRTITLAPVLQPLLVTANGIARAVISTPASVFVLDDLTVALNTDVPWLSEKPISGTLATGSRQVISVTFDAGVPEVTQPGNYLATLNVSSNDPIHPVYALPITMTTIAPATWGRLGGTVTGLGYCDANPVPLANASVFVQSGDGLTWTLTTSISGTYQVWLDQAHSPLTVTVTAADHQTQQVSGVMVTGQFTTTTNFDLRWLRPCLSVNPDQLAVTVGLGVSTTLPLTLTNPGAGAATFNIGEQPRGSLPAVAVAAGVSVNNKGETVTHQVTGVYPLAPGDFTSRASSPVPLTSLTVEPGTGYIYGQQNEGYGFYRYDPYLNSWTTLSSSPLYSGNNGGAAYLDGKIYTVYTQNSYQLGVYDIASNLWSTITNTLGQGTGNITSDGEYLYLAGSYSFVRYHPDSGVWNSLAAPSIGFQPWGGLSYLNGTIYGHQGNDYSGFAKYDIASNVWTTLSSVPGGAVLGSAIDPAAKVYYAYGSYGGQNWYAFDLVNQTWSMSMLPLFAINDGGLAFVGQAGVSGIYFVQGESGTGFGRFETASYSGAVPWLSEKPISGTLATGSRQVISVTFDAGVPEVTQPGNYYATLIIATNDMNIPQIRVPLTMTVSPAMPDLSTSTKVVNRTVANPGDTLLYTLTVSNTGNTTANVTLTDPIPVGLTYNLGSVSNATYNDITNRIEWSGTLALNTQRVITFRATINAGIPDETLITNTLSLADGINPAVVKTAKTLISNRPDLATSTKTVDRAWVNQGGTVTYTITLLNTGNVAASVTLTDPLPSGARYILGSGIYNSTPIDLYNDVTNQVEWSGSVPSGGSAILSFRTVITATSGTLVTNTVFIDDGHGTIITRQVGTQSVRFSIYLPSVLRQ